ncbi:MAG: hypothetical protein AB7V56_10090 [Candidatus Nitrosocosmicus sp.]|nr:hypothetical protein [Candidatus Nitrosocosmicus sp.]HET6590552.1 hypothetical protein [Candidatus Nitrosocosmicus sp.]
MKSERTISLVDLMKSLRRPMEPVVKDELSNLAPIILDSSKDQSLWDFISPPLLHSFFIS